MSWHRDLLGLDIGELPVLDRPVTSWQQPSEDAAAAGIVMAPNVVASPAFVDHMVEVADRDRVAVRAAVDLGPEHAEYGQNPLGAERHGDTLRYDLQVGGSDRCLRDVVIPTLAAGPSRPQPGRMAAAIGTPTGESFVWGIGTWPDLLVVNLLALQAATGDLADEVDADADVHPTAVVERSVIGPGARIDAFAVVRDSVVGAGCEIAEHTSISRSTLGQGTVVQTGALVHGSVVGDATVISFHTAIRGSVLLGSSTISAPVVVRSVVGRDVFLSRGVSLGASTLSDRSISIRHGRRSVDTGMHLLGCVIGNGARLGSGIQLPAGYEVPAERYLVERPIPRQTADLPTRTPLAPTDRGFRAIGLVPTDKGAAQ